MAFPITVDLSARSIRTVDMHTTGEPTRIVFEGYPNLKGTLLEQRAVAKAKHDHIRKTLILEPRGHAEMYGAILRPVTEFTEGEAHMGVLFMTNEGYSTMCGHATIALGRFLVDCHDPNVFPKRDRLRVNPLTKSAHLILHAPCGQLHVTVPTNEDGTKSDPCRPVSFISVESFAVGLDVGLSIPKELSWPELRPSRQITVDLSYGGAFFCIVSASQLGFPGGLKDMNERLPAFSNATQQLKSMIEAEPAASRLIRHPEHEDLSFLYAVIVVDDDDTDAHSDATSETGICFFGAQQIDRSPCGSGVAARVALAAAKGRRLEHQKWTYHSLVSKGFGDGGFTGELHKRVSLDDRGKNVSAVEVAIEGFAYYTGFHDFIIEVQDPLKGGFLFDRLPSKGNN